MATTQGVWQELADGIFTRRYRFYAQQIGVIVGADGVAVIDTRSTHGQGEEIRRDLTWLTSLPVTTVINTHGHYDHAFGNSVFRPATIWGHVRCVSMLELDGERQRASLIEDAPSLAAEVAAVVIDPPDRVFETDATLDIGGRRLELRYLGRAHTDNDIVIHVPDAGVIFAGDLVEESSPPYFGDGYPMDWPATVERVVALEPTTVVPGHGSVGDRAFLATQLEELRAIADLGRRVHAGELDLASAIGAAPYPRDHARESIERAVWQLRGEGSPAS
jgi:glyoxylase-like metal-dependent hydrolase (beta-lactamase superfamily II)